MPSRSASRRFSTYSNARAPSRAGSTYSRAPVPMATPVASYPRADESSSDDDDNLGSVRHSIKRTVYRGASAGGYVPGQDGRLHWRQEAVGAWDGDGAEDYKGLRDLGNGKMRLRHRVTQSRMHGHGAAIRDIPLDYSSSDESPSSDESSDDGYAVQSLVRRPSYATARRPSIYGSSLPMIIDHSTTPAGQRAEDACCGLADAANFHGSLRDIEEFLGVYIRGVIAVSTGDGKAMLRVSTDRPVPLRRLYNDYHLGNHFVEHPCGLPGHVFFQTPSHEIHVEFTVLKVRAIIKTPINYAQYGY